MLFTKYQVPGLIHSWGQWWPARPSITESKWPPVELFLPGQYFNKWWCSNGARAGSAVMWFPGAGAAEAWVESQAKSSLSLIRARCQSSNMLRWHWAPSSASVIGLLLWLWDQRVYLLGLPFGSELMQREREGDWSGWERETERWDCKIIKTLRVS